MWSLRFFLFATLKSVFAAPTTADATDKTYPDQTTGATLTESKVAVLPYSGPGAVQCLGTTSDSVIYSSTTIPFLTSTIVSANTTGNGSAETVTVTQSSLTTRYTTVGVVSDPIGTGMNSTLISVGSITDSANTSTTTAATSGASPLGFSGFGWSVNPPSPAKPSTLLSFSTSTASPSAPAPAFPSASPQWRGLNVVNQSPTDPSRMKNTAEWDTAFRNVRNFAPYVNAVRLYSTTDPPYYRHLLLALPVARKYNLGVHVGVWSGGDDHQDRFAVEKEALNDVLTRFGCGNIIAVSVGNEDMYNNRTVTEVRMPLADISLLVDQTRAIKGLLRQHNCGDRVKVTHTDTAGDWLQTQMTEALVREVDFLSVNAFPYWESLHIDESADAFWGEVRQTQQMAARYGKEIWIGETGWPITGPQQGPAVPGVENLRTYWKKVGCELMNQMNAFWYVEWDQDSSVSFGMMDPAGQSIIGNVDCHSV